VKGIRKFSISELERVAVYLDPIQARETREDLEVRRQKLLGGEMRGGIETRYSAYLVVGSEFRPLPIGATFDAERGVLYWQPGPGFSGEFTFALLCRESGGALIVQLFQIQVGKLLPIR